MRKPRRVATYLLLIGCLFCLVNFTVRFLKEVPNVRPSYSGSVIWQWSRLDGQMHQSQTEQNNTRVASVNVSLNKVSDAKFRQFIRRINLAQLVRNEDQFGRLPSPSDPNLSTAPDSAFVIQIHSRLENLRLLIESLKRVKYIESSLLVFSTDFISDDLIDLIESVRFARTIQIYYPHSNQAFPDTFPGSSSGDCTGKLSQQVAERLGCSNAKWMDKYSQYRDPSIVQAKHHWLWKIRFVFEHLVALSHYDRNVIFLEEDHYVVEDILHLLRLVERQLNASELSGIVSFGSYAAQQTYTSNEEQALILTQRLSGTIAGHLYPPVLNIKPLSTKRLLKFRANGGWADPRDHALCQSMANASWNSSLLLWAPQLTAHSPIY
ncbi:hypothetical protein AHF37_02800 [Paragonimus kellicotti]|nr:hypothetical protein AHF37_02800 [Paragonimus kellicotti]